MKSSIFRGPPSQATTKSRISISFSFLFWLLSLATSLPRWGSWRKPEEGGIRIFWKGRGRAGLTRFGKAWTRRRVSQAFHLLSSRVLIGVCISCTAHRLRFRIPEPLRFVNRTRSSLSRLCGFSTSLLAAVRATSCLNQVAREPSPPFTTQSDLLSLLWICSSDSAIEIGLCCTGLVCLACLVPHRSHALACPSRWHALVRIARRGRLCCRFVCPSSHGPALLIWLCPFMQRRSDAGLKRSQARGRQGVMERDRRRSSQRCKACLSRPAAGMTDALASLAWNERGKGEGASRRRAARGPSGTSASVPSASAR